MLPATIPELYGGFGTFYPPLFHFLGAAWVKLLGDGAFPYLNFFVTALLVAWIALDGRAGADRAARRWAVLLCVSNGWLSLHALRLYVEQLTALLAVGAVLGILALRRAPGRRRAILLGLTAGLALVAKQSMLLLVVLLAALALGYALRRERAVARGLALSAGVSLLVAAPFWIRNALLFGSPLYPAFARDQHPLLYELNRRAFTPAPLDFYRATAEHVGWPLGLALLAAAATAASGRKATLEIVLLGAAAGLAVAGPLQPLLDPRHLLPVIAAAAVLAAFVAARGLAARPAWRAAASVALLLAAFRSAVPMPNYRAALDLPAPLAEAFAETRRLVPEGETVLSLWTYDTWYYARRPATWPIAWGQQDPPVEMFLTADCDSVLGAFRRHGLRYALVPRAADGPAFDGLNYPDAFVACVEKLIARRDFRLLWLSREFGLIEVPDTPPAPGVSHGEARLPSAPAAAPPATRRETE